MLEDVSHNSNCKMFVFTVKPIYLVMSIFWYLSSEKFSTSLISNHHTLHYLIDTATDAVTSSTTQQGGDKTSSSSTTKYTRSDAEGTWWIVLSVISGGCTPVFIFWIVIKVIQCRRLVDLLFTLNF